MDDIRDQSHGRPATGRLVRDLLNTKYCTLCRYPGAEQSRCVPRRRRQRIAGESEATGSRRVDSSLQSVLPYDLTMIVTSPFWSRDWLLVGSGRVSSLSKSSLMVLYVFTYESVKKIHVLSYFYFSISLPHLHVIQMSI